MKPSWSESWNNVMNEMHIARERKKEKDRYDFLCYKQFLHEVKKQEEFIQEQELFECAKDIL